MGGRGDGEGKKKKEGERGRGDGRPPRNMMQLRRGVAAVRGGQNKCARGGGGGGVWGECRGECRGKVTHMEFTASVSTQLVVLYALGVPASATHCSSPGHTHLSRCVFASGAAWRK